jgi:hypothetical protein
MVYHGYELVAARLKEPTVSSLSPSVEGGDFFIFAKSKQ